MSGDVYIYGRLAHILTVIFWIGGTVVTCLAAAAAVEEGETGALKGMRRALLTVATPAMIIAWIAGLTLLVMGWSVYGKMGWMHAKLTLVLVVTGLSGVLGGRIRRAASGDRPLGARATRNLALGTLVVAVLIVSLAVLKPGG